MGDVECKHPYNLDSVDGSYRWSCYNMRHSGDLMHTKCTLGKLFEEKEKSTESKLPWYKRLF